MVKDAAYDLRFLLNRNYKKKGALAFVANKYLLSLDERNYVARCVFSDSKSAFRKNKLVDLHEIDGNSILVDGFNVLITVESICRKDYEYLILCDDGVIRDLNAVFGKYKINEMTEIALNTILDLLKNNNPLKIDFFFDKQVSFSGKLANLTEEIMDVKELNGEAILSKNVDFEIIKIMKDKNDIVATSDGIIMDKVERIVDLSFYLLKK
ncbi:MAG TPA: DUF434 domain-containing protein [Methanobacterium sp.]|nr:DUF434 domain-containing protein [Methanobacterium sp.]